MTTKLDDEQTFDTSHRLSIELNPNRITGLLLTIIIGLALLSLGAAYLHFVAGVPGIDRLAKGFLLDKEGNLPTLFSFTLLLACALLLAIKAMAASASRSPWRYHWIVLPALFYFIAFDEAAQFHERFILVLRTFFNASGFLYFAWVIPGLAIVGVLGVAYFRFVLALPRPVAIMTASAAALYIGGAIGVEMIGGDYLDRHGEEAMESFSYHLITGFEETLEMTGAVLFLHALMRVLGRNADGIRVHLKIH